MLVDVALWLSLLSGVMTLIVGLIHVGTVLSASCDSSDTQSCVGPMLKWNPSDFLADSNDQWRSVFTLQPDLVFFNWSPILFGLMTLAIHFAPSVRWNAICYNWGRMCLWAIFVALFGNFGYAGGLGIITGFFTSFVGLLALIIELQYSDAPTCLGLQVCRYGGYNLSGSSLVGTVTLLFALLAALLTLTVGVIHIFKRLPDPCNSDVFECVGPGLFWSRLNSDFTDDINMIWRSFFTLAPSVFIANFTPFVIGAISCAAQLTTTAFLAITSSWSMVCVWNLVQGLLVAGYAGNLGILTMFLCSIVAILAFFLSLSRGPPEQRRFGFQFFSRVSSYSQQKQYSNQGAWSQRSHKPQDNPTQDGVSGYSPY